MKRVVLLGATGSIGRSAGKVVREHPDDFQIVSLAARSNRAAAEELGAEFGAKAYVGEDAAVRAVAEHEADLVLVATVGLSGLAPTLAAIDRGMDVALATKEVLVAAGELVTGRARAKGVRLLPVDSEHSAIFQCIQENAQQGLKSGGVACEAARDVDRLVLTTSGGPFLEAPESLDAVTPAQALAHPSWKMGPKVTVDSSTMMNKGFEILEARWLFDVPVRRIDVVVHPQSVIHSLVTFTDGSTLAQLAPPDMCVPIQYALTWPERRPSPDRARLDLAALGSLVFRAPDEKRFPCLRLVKEAAERGGCSPAVLSAADEIAVERFLAGDIRYTDISRLVSDMLEKMPSTPCDSIETVFAVDAQARTAAREWRGAKR